MDLPLDRRHMLFGASGLAACLMTSAGVAAEARGPLSPERSLDAFRRTVCGDEGEEVLWWYIGDLYDQMPGQSVVPVARALTIGRFTAGKSTTRSFRHHFHEVGLIVDLNTGEPLQRNPYTGAAVEIPKVEEPAQDIEWVVQDDGNVIKSVEGRATKLNLRWTTTADNMLLLESDPTENAFGVTSGDSGADWKSAQATRSYYAKTASFKRPGFVPAFSTYSLALKATLPWLANQTKGDRFLIVRGIGQKSRKGEVVNQDSLDLVRRFFPKFI